jgi:5-methylcytosine-specific restriction protein A
MEKNPQVWFMVKEAIENLDGELSYGDIKQYINSRWENVNQDTITAQIIVATVNHNSRTHYNENKVERFTDSGSNFDLLYSLDRGKVIKYSPGEHGIWEIVRNSDGRFKSKFRGLSYYLFAWNPANWSFDELDEKVNEIKTTGKTTVIWSIQSFKKVKVGDRAFIVQIGTKVRGIFASGYVISKPALLPHWSQDGTLVNRVTIELDVLINPRINEIFNINDFNTGILKKQHWTPQSSGIQIKNEVTGELERRWFTFLNDNDLLIKSPNGEKIIVEGAPYQVTQTVYERNRYARALCLRHHGYACCVCNFNFEEVYGYIGKDFIHVHHLSQLSTMSVERETNPIVDLRPVCPNCHAMLHKRTPPYEVGELKKIIEDRKWIINAQ